MGTLMTTLFVALGLGVVVAFLIAAATGRRGKSNVRSAVVAGVVVALLLIVGIAIANSFTQVEAGSVAVVKQFGRVIGVFSPGLNLKIPFIQDTVPYRT